MLGEFCTPELVMLPLVVLGFGTAIFGLLMQAWTIRWQARVIQQAQERQQSQSTERSTGTKDGEPTSAI